MKVVTISYSGQIQNENLKTSIEDKAFISSVDKEEVDAQARLNWITPKNILHNNHFGFTYNNTQYLLELDQIGEFSEAQIVVGIVEVINSKFDDKICQFNEKALVNRNRFALQVNQTHFTNFFTNDYWFAKIIGAVKGKIYTPDDTGLIFFERKMFLGIARMLNVVCYQAKEATQFEKKKIRFILIKAPYSYAPGQNSIVTSDGKCTFSIDQLQLGISIHICDENFEELILEGETYYLDLVIQKSARRLQNEEQDQIVKQQQAEQLQKTLEQKQEFENQQQAQLQQSLAQFNNDLEETRKQSGTTFWQCITQYKKDKQQYDNMRSDIAVQYPKIVKARDQECKQIEDMINKATNQELQWGRLMEQFREKLATEDEKLLKTGIQEYDEEKQQYTANQAKERGEITEHLQNFNFDQIFKIGQQIKLEKAQNEEKVNKQILNQTIRLEREQNWIDSQGIWEDNQAAEAKQRRKSVSFAQDDLLQQDLEDEHEEKQEELIKQMLPLMEVKNIEKIDIKQKVERKIAKKQFDVLQSDELQQLLTQYQVNPDQVALITGQEFGLAPLESDENYEFKMKLQQLGYKLI